MCLQPRFKFIDEAAFSQTRLSFHDDHVAMAIGHTLPKSRLYGLKFRFAADHSCCSAFDPSSADSKSARPHTMDKVCSQRLGLAFHYQRRLLLHIEHTTHQLIV